MLEVDSQIHKINLQNRVEKSLRISLAVLKDGQVNIDPKFRLSTKLSQLSGSARQDYASRALERTLRFVDKFGLERHVEPNLLDESINIMLIFR